MIVDIVVLEQDRFMAKCVSIDEADEVCKGSSLEHLFFRSCLNSVSLL